MADAVLKAIGGWTYRDCRLWSFFSAIMIYALWGTPTPDDPGLVEILIALLLIIAAGTGGGFHALNLRRGSGWEQAGRVLLLYGLSLPVFAGMLAGNSLQAMVRDILPFLFLLMPLFLVPLFQARGQDIKLLTGFIIVLGLVFSLRVLLPYLSQYEMVMDPFLLANAPTVLFTALLLIGLCGLRLYHWQLFSSALLFGMALLPLVTMALITQRASIGVFCLSVLFLMGLGLWRRPLRVVMPLALMVLTMMIYWPVMTELWQGLMHKTELVGFNMRWQEAVAVFREVNDNVLTVLFGKGWGASVWSPAAGGVTVNFTHNIFTTYWLKAGLAGVLLLLAYLFQLGVLILRLLWRFPVMALALAGPFLIDITLYASFKSLDFGLVLLLIPLWAQQCLQRAEE